MTKLSDSVYTAYSTKPAPDSNGEQALRFLLNWLCAIVAPLIALDRCSQRRSAVNGRTMPVPVEVYKQLLAEKLLAEAPTLEAFRKL